MINEKLRKENCLSLNSIFFIQRGLNTQNFPKNMHNIFLNISPNYQQCYRKFRGAVQEEICLETVRSFFIQHMAKIFISKGLKFQK